MSKAKDLSDVQKRKWNIWQLACDSAIKYFAKEIPPLNNLTKEGILEMLGDVKEARKDMQKVEAVLAEQYKSMLDKKTRYEEVRTDHYAATLTKSCRTALNQSKAKAYLEDKGILSDFMSETETETLNVKHL